MYFFERFEEDSKLKSVWLGCKSFEKGRMEILSLVYALVLLLFPFPT